MEDVEIRPCNCSANTPDWRPVKAVRESPRHLSLIAEGRSASDFASDEEEKLYREIQWRINWRDRIVTWEP